MIETSGQHVGKKASKSIFYKKDSGVKPQPRHLVKRASPVTVATMTESKEKGAPPRPIARHEWRQTGVKRFAHMQ